MILGNNLRKLGWDVAMNIHIMNYGSYVLYTTCTVRTSNSYNTILSPLYS